MIHKPTKNTYSFSKSKRFSKVCTNYITANYTLNRSLNQRAHSIGKGPRSDFTKCTSNAPPPTKYNLLSAFDISKEKGKTFGVSRDKTKEFGYITQNILRHPGVGNYNCKNHYDPRIQYSMRPKTQSKWLPNFLNESYVSDVPAPGDYESADVDHMGQTMYSRFRSSRCHRMGKEERFQRIRNSVPGPSQYIHPDSINDSGLYYESKHRGQGKRIISKEPRKSFIDQIQKKSSQDQEILFHSDAIYDSEF